MSERLRADMAAAAVKACAALAGIVTSVGNATYRTLSWLSEEQQREVERLENVLTIAAPTHVTTKEAIQVFQKNLTDIEAQMARHPLLKPHKDALARVLALRRSPLRLFVDDAQWKRIVGAKINAQAFNGILKQAGRSFTHANGAYIAQSISQVAMEAGFINPGTGLQRDDRRTMVMKDDQGRALIAHITESDDGAKIDMDLTGFGDGACHEVMDSVLRGLAEKDIHLGKARRRSHYRRDGAIASITERIAKKSKPVQGCPDEERRHVEMRRKRHHHGTDRVKIKT